MTALSEPRVEVSERTTSARIIRALNRTPIHIALGLIALIWLAPTVGLLVTSFRPRSDIQVTGWWESFLQFRFTFENYAAVLNSQGMLRAFVNTALIAIPSTLIPVTLASMAAYAFSWLHFPFRDGLFLLVVALLMIPLQVAFIPLLKLFAPTGLLNGFGAIWLTHTAFALPFGIFLLRNFFITLPRDLIEAARIDGASTLGIFRKIVVPLSVPAIAAYGIFQFLWVWNDLLMALVFVQRGDAWPMTKAIQNLLSQYGTEWHLLAAGAFILMFVPLIVFFSLQRFFVQGLLAGSVK
ncbi:MAG TPA: carbohydrate ABC transporter permease [Candidatus Limnocylindrales bacterium]|nr:carbohydrate ABC transporter permease [Candidatus Limnocylindrales bacterium]